jgi:MFS family permease
VSNGRILKNPWWVVFGSTLVLFVGYGPITLFTFGVFLNPNIATFGCNRAPVGVASPVSQGLGALATPFVGKMVDRWGVRRVTLPFITAFALLTAAIALTPASPLIFILLYGICGLAGGGQAPLNYAKAISSWFETKRGLALGIAMSGVGIGTALDPQIVRVLIDHVGWRGAYVGLGILTFVVAFPAVAFFVREPDRESVSDRDHLAAGGHSRDLANVTGIPLREAIKGYRFWLILCCVFMVASAVNGSIAHIVPILTDRGISAAMATSLLSVTGIALIGGRILSGYFLDRFFAPYVAACFFVLPLTGIGLLSSGAAGVVPLIGTICLGLGIGSEIDIMAFLVGRYFGVRTFGEVYGWIMGVFVFASGLGPTIMGLCYDHTHSYNLALEGFAAALALSSILITRLGPYAFPARRELVVSEPAAAALTD